MSGEVMVRHCSPTLAGLKTGSMFSYPFANNSDLYDSVRYWNRLFTGKGLRVLPLCHRDGRALIYVFRPQKLCQDLRDSTACELLRFIENNAKNSKYVGYWKVYGDEQAARKRFELYDRCTRIYCQRWAKERNIERLTVAG